MNTTLKNSFLALALSVGIFTFTPAQAAQIETTKGLRLTVAQESTTTFKSARTVGKIHCPEMKNTVASTTSNVDSKGRSKVHGTQEVYAAGSCSTIQQKNASTKESQSVMVCPNGTLTPGSCHKM